MVVAVGYDGAAFFLEGIEVIDYPAAEEGASVFQGGFIDDDVRPFGFDPLHDALDGALAEVIGVGLHGEPVHADGDGLFFRLVVLAAGVVVTCRRQDPVGDEIFPGAVGLHDGFDEVFRITGSWDSRDSAAKPNGIPLPTPRRSCRGFPDCKRKTPMCVANVFRFYTGYSKSVAFVSSFSNRKSPFDNIQKDYQDMMQGFLSIHIVTCWYGLSPYILLLFSYLSAYGAAISVSGRSTTSSVYHFFAVFPIFFYLLKYRP